MKSKASDFKISDFKTTARANLPGCYGTCISTMLICFFIIFLVTVPFSIWQTNNPGVVNTIVYYAAMIIISMIATVFSAGVFRIHLAIARNLSFSFMDLFWGFRNQPDRFLIAGLILTILAQVFLIPGRIVLATGSGASQPSGALPAYAAGYVLLAAGGVVTIVFLLMFSQTLFLLLDHSHWKATAALRESYHMMKGNKWTLFRMEISFIGWALLGLVSFGIGYLWIIPYIFQTGTVFYLKLLPEQTYTENR